MPRLVESNGSSLTYSYFSDGTKVSALLQDGSGRKYRGSFVYRVDEPGVESLESIAWDEGRIVLTPELLADPAPDDSVAVEEAIGDVVIDSDVVDTTACVNTIRDEWHVRDHLGNVRMVVDLNAWDSESAVLEQSDYLPFGTRAGNWYYATLEDNRYRYAGKEEQRYGGAGDNSGSADSGTNLGQLDFGARYYDPSICRWTTIDPLAHKYPGLSPYNYCGNDPINKVDPDGRIWDTFWDLANVAMDAKSLVSNIKAGNTKDAIVDGIGLASDVLAAAIPLVPGGAGAAIKAARGADQLADASRIVDKASDVSKSKALSKQVSTAPLPNDGYAPKHGGSLHNSSIDNARSSLDNSLDIRKNQAQVDINGKKVGNNRPDLQYNSGGVHYNIEFDFSLKNNRHHQEVILKNDPSSVFIGHILKK